jgi:hypothetical protein
MSLDKSRFNQHHIKSTLGPTLSMTQNSADSPTPNATR